MTAKTHWPRVWIAYLGGCISAFHIGKVVAALPLLIDNLGLTLTEAGWLLSLFTLISAVVGALLGMLADRLGPARLAVTGLCIAALGTWAGSLGNSFSWLIAFRMVEGLGFILTIVCCPSLISRSVVDRDRPLAMGLWGSFIPVGVSSSMFVTPLILDLHGWRGVWIDIGLLNLFWAFLIFMVFVRREKLSEHKAPQIADLIGPVKKLSTLMLVLGFACYSALYQAVTALLPTMLVSDYNMLLANAAYLGAFVVMVNMVGNIGSGWLIGRGLQPWLLQVVAIFTMGVSACFIFLPFTEPLVKMMFGVLFSVFGGLFPGTAFVLAARFSVTPAHVALMVGLLLQGSGFGQMIGPLITTAVVDASGTWEAALPGFVIVTLIGLGSVMMMKKSVG